MQKRGKTVLAYVSLGQAEEHRHYFAKARNQGVLLHEDPRWPGARFVDVRNFRWTDLLLNERIPGIVAEGFDGLFLDTLDAAMGLETLDPIEYGGMTAACAYLVRRIREQYPQLRIMLNRSYELLPIVDEYIDMVLGESIFSEYDFVRRQYVRKSDTEYAREAKILLDAKQRRPKLLVMTLDYWDPQDKPFIAAIYKLQRSRGFHPYVATVKLNQLIAEP